MLGFEDGCALGFVENFDEGNVLGTVGSTEGIEDGCNEGYNEGLNNGDLLGDVDGMTVRVSDGFEDGSTLTMVQMTFL